MIEDTEYGIKIAEPEEAIWTKVKEAREQTIKSYEDSLIIERAILDLAKEKLKKFENEEKIQQ